MASSARLACCALHYVRLGEYDSLETVKGVIKQGIDASTKNVEPKAWFAVTKPSEQVAVGHLKSLGFKELVKFPRCDIYTKGTYPSSDTELTMWFANKDELTLEPKVQEATHG
mgnify:CR=1 FL=1